jgi:hypothetical protein
MLDEDRKQEKGTVFLGKDEIDLYKDGQKNKI